VIKVEKLIRKQGLWLILVGIFILSFSSYDVEAISAPSFETLPMDDSMITGVKNAGSVQGEEGHNYVQINDGQKDSSGAVWFNKSLSFSKSFHLEMAFCIDQKDNDSDGLAFVLQTNGKTSIANDTGPTIGVWSNFNKEDGKTLNAGAILNSFAIEFDTFYNNTEKDHSMDLNVESSSSEHHIAWAFPGSEASYDIKNYSGFLYSTNQKVLKHNNVVVVDDLSDSKWHTFTVDYTEDGANSVLRYEVPDFQVNVTIPVNDTFKTNLGISDNQTPVYFGFTGANGGYAQNKAVSFVNVEGLVDIEMRTGVLRQNESIPFLDTGNPESQTDEIIESTKEVYYVTSIDYKNTSVLPELDTGIKLSYLMPDGLSVENVYFNLYEKGNSTIPSGGDPLSYSQEGGELVVDLPEMTRGNLYTVSFSVSYTGDSVNKNIELTVPVVTTFNGNMYVSSVTTGAVDTHCYKIKGIFPPTITTGKSTITEINDLPIARQNRNYYPEITIDDQNSTQAQVFVSAFFTKASELTEESFTKKEDIQRPDLTVKLSATLELSTENLTPGTIYYFAVYVKDKEGNTSEISYFGIDFRGIVQLLKVPESLNGCSLTINQLAQSVRSDGYAYVEVPTDEQARILEVSNTSEGSWKLSGQTSAFMNGEQSLADEIQLVLYNPQDNELLCTIDANQKVLFEKTPQDGQTFVLDLSEYNCYLRFKTAIESITPGTYLGEVQWQLESTITDS
jgi:hypothetical protein